jgi:uncharacterized protein YodC (DUF2158 family)
MKPGDVVVLKSGGPKMTIEKIFKLGNDDYESARCQWFEGAGMVIGTFPLTSLEVSA